MGVAVSDSVHEDEDDVEEEEKEEAEAAAEEECKPDGGGKDDSSISSDPSIIKSASSVVSTTSSPSSEAAWLLLLSEEDEITPSLLDRTTFEFLFVPVLGDKFAKAPYKRAISVMRHTAVLGLVLNIGYTIPIRPSKGEVAFSCSFEATEAGLMLPYPNSIETFSTALRSATTSVCPTLDNKTNLLFREKLTSFKLGGT